MLKREFKCSFCASVVPSLFDHTCMARERFYAERPKPGKKSGDIFVEYDEMVTRIEEGK